jgi:hypothetical protein
MPNVLAVAPACSLSPVLPGYNFADAYMIRVEEPSLTAREAAERAFRRVPRWFEKLMALRNFLAGLAGLKSSREEFAAPDAPVIGIFPVISETTTRVILGFNDYHLDFRIIIDAIPEPDAGTSVVVSTLVHTHNLMGRAYLASIMPFHKFIARTFTGNVAWAEP